VQFTIVNKPVSLVITLACLIVSQQAGAAETGSLATGEPAMNIIADGVWSSPDGSTVTYEALFFEPYQSVTAADMLRWVPGGAALLPSNNRNNQQSKRGFGSGGDQILINGKRISGKSNDINSAIQRIQASVVTRVEVIRGTTAGLDVRSEGTLINIVLGEELSGGSGSWQMHSGFYGDSPEYDGLVSYSNTNGSLKYLVSAQYGPYNRGQAEDRYEDFYDVGGTLYEQRLVDRPELKNEIVLNSSGSWEFANGDVFNLNARVEDKEEERFETTRVTTIGDPDTTLLQNASVEDGIDWELGGDIENRIGTSGTLKTRAIFTSKTEDESESVSLSSSVPGNVPSQSLVLSDALETEAIVRSSYSWPVANAQNLELGLEGALNTLEKDVQLFAVLGDGSLDPVDVFNSDSDVEENRFEFFSTHFWQMRENIALESALNVEHSKIEQVGADVDNSRSFTYVKPRFDLRWDRDDANQLRGSLERTISQLNFSDFVARFNDDDDQVNAGNPDLEPEKAWEWKLTYERRLGNDSGILEAQLFYNQIEDHIDRVAATDIISAPGNIGDAEIYGINLKGSWRLAPLGLEGAVIDMSYGWLDSETTDPFTGRKRPMRFKPQNRYSIKFRHDVTDWKLNYTVDIDWFGERFRNEITYVDRNNTLEPRVHTTAQYRLTDTLLLWLDARFILDDHTRRVRQRYSGNIGDGILLRTEVREQYKRSSFIIGLRGQF
jgi:hypothetical protein